MDECKPLEAGVTFIREYDQCRNQAVDFVFVSVKTYSLPAVKADLDAFGRGLHSFPFPLNLSLLCPFPLNLSSHCPPYDPN